MKDWTQRTAIGIAVAHTLLIGAYTMPVQVVPMRIRYWSQAYARVLFHQDWRLFAPDPPACGCSIEFREAPSAPWSRLDDLHRSFIWKRMAANACRYAEASPRDGRGGILPGTALEGSMLEMTGHDKGTEFVMHRSCTDTLEERISIRPSQDPR